MALSVTGALAADSAGIEFFEKKIRPIFVETCYKCHSSEAEKVKGGLLLDTRDGLLKGGETGPALVPGNADKSLLIKAVRYTDENLQMPPKGKKLSPEQIADLEAWIKMGAPDPRTGKPATLNPQLAAQKQHWAFQPIRQSPLPTVKNSRWVKTPLDAFILAKLEAKKLTPATPADKRTLIRRATFDLIGLPPTPQEVNDFVADKSPEAYARLVDRLLNSPHYGERWGRYWLDVARYADTKGYVFEEERRYPYAYTYRDYVVRALNEDLPFDQFVIQQIAADLLPLGEDKRPLAALGFLTLGRRFLNNQPDIIDDRIDVITRGTMGLTVACARCHDHKFDPIPTKDYYSLYGVFASSSEPADKPLLGKAALPKEYKEYLIEHEKRENEFKQFRESKEAEARTKLHSQVGQYLLAAFDASKLTDKGKQEGLVRERKLDPSVMQRWKGKLESWKKSHHAIFAPWFAFTAIPEKEFEVKAKELGAKFAANTGTNSVNPIVARALAEPLKSLKQVAERYDKIFSEMDQQWKVASTKTNGVTALPDANQEALRQVLHAAEAPVNLDAGELVKLFDTPAQQKMRTLRRKVEELDATHPGAPPRAMALQDNPTPNNPHVFVRGNPGNPGPEVPRQFLELLSGEKRTPFQKGSGRLELAQSIASTNNPLTARVIVNRIWMYHFGAPLVRTPSDFGVRSEPPSHPELLDYLASRFMQEGWSMKKLHRLIMLSSTYQQGSEENFKNAKIDPANQMFWRMNRRRLDFEAMRDTLLMVSGKIDLNIGGRPEDITVEPFTPRRTVYGLIERQNLPGLFRTFDFASPDATSPGRFATTVPQQALFLMNSPFVLQQAKGVLNRTEIISASDEVQKLQQLYQLAFQRAADADEIKLAQKFLHAQSAAGPVAEAPVWQYGWGEVDETSKRIKQFQKLPHFTGYGWQGSTNLPDPALGWVLLSAEGGHAGNDLKHAAIRRWRAVRDGIVTIHAELDHPSEKGDGVRARIISSRQGEVSQWTAHHQKVATHLERVEVKKGDTIDFVVDCRGDVGFDSFTWAPVLKYISDGTKGAADETREWNAKSNFSGPPKEKPKSLTAWEKYAQVLLLANEFVFVD